MAKGTPKWGGESWTDAADSRLQLEWRKGTLTKVIGQLLDPPRTPQAVVARRIALGLPPRRGSNREKRLSVEVSVAELEHLQTTAARSGRSVSAYVRRLIQLDMGKT